MMDIALIAAIAENGVIGYQNTLPWRLKGELKIFSEITRGHPVIMGRKTYDSLPKKPLPERLNIVISRSVLGEPSEDTQYVQSLEAAIATASAWDKAQESPKNTVMVLGGAKIYHQSLPIADIFYRTIVHASPVGDTFFPEYTLEDWQRESVLCIMEASENHSGYTVEKWRKTK